MAFIATGASTVGEVVTAQAEFFLNGMFAEKKPGKGVTQKEIAQRNAARRALQVFTEHLNELYCGDADTLLADVPVPTAAPKVVQA